MMKQAPYRVSSNMSVKMRECSDGSCDLQDNLYIRFPARLCVNLK